MKRRALLHEMIMKTVRDICILGDLAYFDELDKLGKKKCLFRQKKLLFQRYQVLVQHLQVLLGLFFQVKMKAV